MSSTDPSPRRSSTRMGNLVAGSLVGVICGGTVGALGLAAFRAAIAPADAPTILLAGILGAILGGIYGTLYGILHWVVFHQNWWRFGSVAGNDHPRPIPRLVFHLGGLGLVPLLAAGIWWSQATNIPDASNVLSMTARFSDATRKSVSFSVAPRDFSVVLKALTPATRDWSPAKWIGAGNLIITCLDGRKIQIDLYQTNQESAAFSLHPDGASENLTLVSNYFRGGTSDSIANALQTAYKNARKE